MCVCGLYETVLTEYLVLIPFNGYIVLWPQMIPWVNSAEGPVLLGQHSLSLPLHLHSSLIFFLCPSLPNTLYIYLYLYLYLWVKA